MTERLDDLLRALPAPSAHPALDQLEPRVWRRIDAARRRQEAGPGVGFQLIAAGTALAIGLALGWSHSSGARRASDVQSLYASYAAVGPMARLESGL